MKILAIGRNYTNHIKELGNAIPEEPVIFMKPDTALLKNNEPFYFPEFSSEIHYEAELILKIGKEGKHIAEKFASNYIEGIGIGIDFTARDLQGKLKEKGLPWVLAKGFNGAAPVSGFKKSADFPDFKNIHFSLTKNAKTMQKGNSAHMIYSFEEIIAYISKFITLKKGDILFTGTPEGVGSINIGDKLEGFLEGEKMLEVAIK